MDAGQLRGSNDGLGIGLRIEPGDVAGDCAGQHLDLLGQIAEIAAERVPFPLIVCCPVDPHLAECCWPYPKQSLDQS